MIQGIVVDVVVMYLVSGGAAHASTLATQRTAAQRNASSRERTACV